MSIELLLLSLSLFTWGIGEGMFMYFQPIYLQQLGADTMTIASTFSLVGLAMMAAHIPAGYLADRLGRKPLLVAAWIFGLASAWTMALAHTLPVFVIGWLMYALTAFVSSPLNSYVTAARGRMNPARALTLVSVTYNLGAAIGPITGGWIGDRFDLRTVYIVAACIFIFSTGMVLFIRSQPREKHDPSSPAGNLLQNQRYLGFLVVAFLAIFAMYLPQPLAPRFLQNERSLSLEQIGLLGSIGSLGNALFSFGLGFLPARLGFLLGQVAVALFAILLWRGAGVLWYGLGYFMLGGYRAARTLVFAQVQALIHSAHMGLAYGFTEASCSLAVILAPLLSGWLYTRDPLLVYPVALGLIVFAVIVSMLFAPRAKAALQPAIINSPDSPFPS
jgi:MFS family permease